MRLYAHIIKYAAIVVKRVLRKSYTEAILLSFRSFNLEVVGKLEEAFDIFPSDFQRSTTVDNKFVHLLSLLGIVHVHQTPGLFFFLFKKNKNN